VEDADYALVTPEEAARLLFDDPRAQITFEAANEEQARRAVTEFAALFDKAPGVFKVAFEGARAGAETLSSDRLQGIAEIIQNADDAGAAFVEFRLIDGHLIAVHDGQPVTLSDVLALAMPWLSNKTDDDRSTGRFGIGLTTLQALSKVLDVHSGFYHIRLGVPTIHAIDDGELPLEPDDPLHTALCLPLSYASLNFEELDDWLGRWDDSALLFLRHVRAVRLLGPSGEVARELRLCWGESTEVTRVVGSREVAVQCRHVEAQDGRAWLVHTAEAATPKGVTRASKATGDTVSLGLALPLQPADYGEIYAGLPVEQFQVPIRVNAQFDPVTSRTGLAATSWNDALLPLLADLWTEAVVDLFATEPAEAWKVVPLPPEASRGDASRPVPAGFESLLLHHARTDLPAQARIPVGGTLQPLASLAVEDTSLENVLDPAEVASLAGLAAALPKSARDDAGRWRAVLADWRQADAPLAPVVTVAKALDLLSHPGRSASATISLTAAGLRAGLDAKLALLPCVVTAAGDHVVPPAAGSVQALLASESPLAEELAVGTRLAEEHLVSRDDAQQVLIWLKRIGAVIDSPGNEEVVRRLAAAGRAGHRLQRPLTDDQFRALRDAFEQLGSAVRAKLGRDVGLAVIIDAVRYDSRGRLVPTHACPAEVYLPRAIDREPDSFAIAADKTPGLVWAHRRYAESLRSTAGRGAGLGPQRFLGLLGAERMPRLVAHHSLYRRYSDPRRGLLPTDETPRRSRAMRDIGAKYTLDDVDSPDLRAVALNIATERKAKLRRLRAGALLATLNRGLSKCEDQATVAAAYDSYGWNIRGHMPAYWLWLAGEIPWLDDSHGKPQSPAGLRLRTPGTIAVHGPDAEGYLHRELDFPASREALAALGVTGEPSTRELVERLRALRATDDAPYSVPTEAAIVYRALASRRASHVKVPGDLNEFDLRAAFSEGPGLVHTNLGWRAPAQVLMGPAVFGDYRPFAPQVPGTEQLWAFLRILKPTTEDCLRVTGQLSRARRKPEGTDAVVLLETLRLLSSLVTGPRDLPQPVRKRLSAMALWTTHGWTTKRPVYATDDPALFDGLRDEFPVWDPGGDLAQFSGLLRSSRITRIDGGATMVVAADTAIRDEDATSLFRAAVSLLQEDLARNDPASIGTLTVEWENLRRFEVRIDPDLRVRVEGLAGRQTAEVEVSVKADPARHVLFVRDVAHLRQVNGGGRAIAGLFASSDRHRLAQAWLASWVAAEDGRKALLLKLATQRAAEEQARTERGIAERQEALKAMAGEIADRTRTRRPAPTASVPDQETTTAPTYGPQPPGAGPRTLVDPATLSVADAATPQEGPNAAGKTPSQAPAHPSRGSSSLPPPSPNGAAPRGQSTARGFTDLDKESVGMALLRKIIEDDTVTITDLRGQHGFGADAQDSRGRFYELKVHLGEEPDVVRMEDSEVLRSLSAPGDYYLVVISHVEGAEAHPKVRIIADPIHQLTVNHASAMTLSGVRIAEDSLTYNLEPTNGEHSKDADARKTG
jgi:hypothetical protein